EARALHVALDVEPPALFLRTAEAQRLERDAHLDDVPLRREASARLEHEVRAQVRAAAEHAARTARALRAHAVLLHAQRVHREDVRAPAGDERVQVEEDAGLAPGRVAVRGRRADARRIAVVA